jgi:hypothetical protein
MKSGFFIAIAAFILALAFIVYAPNPAIAILGLLGIAGFLVVTDRA